MAVGLVLTFRATGVFNLAFGAQAFVAAFVYDLLIAAPHLAQWASPSCWPCWSSRPALGLALDRFLFRHIPTASTTAKLLSSVGRAHRHPPAHPHHLRHAPPRTQIAYVWSTRDRLRHLYQTPLNGADIATTVITVVVVAALVALFRWSSIGLQMRAVVESRRLAQLEGVNSAGVAASAWALSSALAGLAGVLMLPAEPDPRPHPARQFTTLLVAGLTAAALASFRSIPKALMWSHRARDRPEPARVGCLPSGSVLQPGRRLRPCPSWCSWGCCCSTRSSAHLDASTDPLAVGRPPACRPRRSRSATVASISPRSGGWRLLLAGFVVSSLTWLPDNWVFPFAPGLALLHHLPVHHPHHRHGRAAVAVPGHLRRRGGFSAGQLATHFGVPILLGAVLGGSWPPGSACSWPCRPLRSSGLPLTLVTLAFAIFADQVLFQYSWSGGGRHRA